MPLFDNYACLRETPTQMNRLNLLLLILTLVALTALIWLWPKSMGNTLLENQTNSSGSTADTVVTDTTVTDTNLKQTTTLQLATYETDSQTENPDNTGPVQIRLSQATFLVNQEISFTVVNRARSLFYATSGQSYCTIFGLEQQSGSWSKVGVCRSAEPAAKTPIQAGDTSYSLHFPNDFGTPSTLTPGTYRVSLSYCLQSASSCQTIYSTSFKVN